MPLVNLPVWCHYTKKQNMLLHLRGDYLHVMRVVVLELLGSPSPPQPSHFLCILSQGFTDQQN